MDWEKKYKTLTAIITDMMYAFADAYAESEETERKVKEHTLATATQCLGYIVMVAVHDFENEDIDAVRELVGCSEEDPCMPYMLETAAMAMKRVHRKRMEMAENGLGKEV